MNKSAWVLTDSLALSELVELELTEMGVKVVTFNDVQSLQNGNLDASPSLLLINGRCKKDDGEIEPPHHKRSFCCGEEMMAFAVKHGIAIIPIQEGGTFNHDQVRALMEA